ncbi:hypothetical protein Clacol_001579 [Clathrus columnatus]|uniref:Uncharacterized protein n=1 Tax=Clathrus columnatus TaxID=1419009 RepID=A0AAV5A1S0_9AGAM|nr:hypothetical protein Clacol_001579 [Clathrus columnatus]
MYAHLDLLLTRALPNLQVHIRRRSLPENWKETTRPKFAPPGRPSTVSPRLPSSELRLQDVNINVIPPKLSSLPLSAIRSLPPPPAPSQSKSIHVDIENCPDVPISSFARRKTPQSSPTTTNFRQRRRSSSFSPVLLPTLLPGLRSSSSPPPSQLSSPDMTNLCEAVTTKLTAPRIVRQQGLRLSSYRSFYIEDKSRRVISAG